MNILKKIFAKKHVEPVDETPEQENYNRIKALETQLNNDEKNTDVKNELMVAYNKALAIYAKCPSYRSQVDEVLEKISELRNVIRRNM